MQKTTNLQLNKPEIDEKYDIELFNENFDIIDDELKKMKDENINDETPTYTVAEENAELASGEDIKTAFGKIAKAIKSLISHITTHASSTVFGHVKVTPGNGLSNSSGTVAMSKGTGTDIGAVKLSDTYDSKVTNGGAANSLGASQNALYNAYTALSKNMTAATASAAGKAGLVPAPSAGAQGKFLRGDGTWSIPTNTKNTAGTTNKTGAKMFLAGATEQSANPQTYSNNNVYIGTDNELYSNGKKVGHQEDIEALNNSLTEQPTFIYDENGKITGYKTKAGADSVFPFKNAELNLLKFLNTVSNDRSTNRNLSVSYKTEKSYKSILVVIIGEAAGAWGDKPTLGMTNTSGKSSILLDKGQSTNAGNQYCSGQATMLYLVTDVPSGTTIKCTCSYNDNNNGGTIALMASIFEC